MKKDIERWTCFNRKRLGISVPFYQRPQSSRIGRDLVILPLFCARIFVDYFRISPLYKVRQAMEMSDSTKTVLDEMTKKVNIENMK